MKRLIAVLAAAALAVAIYAAAAPGSQQAPPTAGQFAALKKQVAKLQKDDTNLKAQFACLSALGVAQFSDGQTFGYVYRHSDGSLIVTSALDITGQGETPTVDLAQIDQSCVTSRRFARASAPAIHRSR